MLPPPPPNDVALCGECGGIGGYCAAGTTCVITDSFGTKACVRYCCDDADCGGQPCTQSVVGIGRVGVCATPQEGFTFLVPVCRGIPAVPPSAGSCWTP